MGKVFADERFGETKETINEGILCLVAHKEKYIAAEQRGTSVVASCVV